MSIIRQAKKPHFFSLSNALAQNNSLSLRARGLMSYLLSLPADWEVSTTHLSNVMKEGRTQIYTILKELSNFGYVHQNKDGFQAKVEYFVFEQSISVEEFKKFLQSSRFSTRLESNNIASQTQQSTYNTPAEKTFPPSLHSPPKHEPYESSSSLSSSSSNKGQVASHTSPPTSDDDLIDRLKEEEYSIEIISTSLERLHEAERDRKITNRESYVLMIAQNLIGQNQNPPFVRSKVLKEALGGGIKGLEQYHERKEVVGDYHSRFQGVESVEVFSNGFEMIIKVDGKMHSIPFDWEESEWNAGIEKCIPWDLMPEEE